MRHCTVFTAAFFLLLMLIINFVFSAAASGEVTLDASLKEVYEDNVNPSLSGPGSPMGGGTGRTMTMPMGIRMGGPPPAKGSTSGTDTGDLYTVLSAAIGSRAEVGVETEMFIKAEATRYQYGKFTELNATSIGLSAGAFRQFSDLLAAQLGLSARTSDYRENARNSKTYGGTLALKQQLTQEFLLREGLGYEKNDADAAVFSYKGPIFSLGAGYLVAPKTLVNAGYGYLIRKFDDGSRTKLHSLTLGIDREIAKWMHIFASYEHQSYEAALPGSDTDNIVTLGISFSY